MYGYFIIKDFIIRDIWGSIRLDLPVGFIWRPPITLIFFYKPNWNLYWISTSGPVAQTHEILVS